MRIIIPCLAQHYLTGYCEKGLCKASQVAQQRVSRQITGLHQVLKALDALSIEPMCQLQGCYAWWLRPLALESEQRGFESSWVTLNK